MDRDTRTDGGERPDTRPHAVEGRDSTAAGGITPAMHCRIVIEGLRQLSCAGVIGLEPLANVLETKVLPVLVREGSKQATLTRIGALEQHVLEALGHSASVGNLGQVDVSAVRRTLATCLKIVDGIRAEVARG